MKLSKLMETKQWLASYRIYMRDNGDGTHTLRRTDDDGYDVFVATVNNETQLKGFIDGIEYYIKMPSYMSYIDGPFKGRERLPSNEYLMWHRMGWGYAQRAAFQRSGKHQNPQADNPRAADRPISLSVAEGGDKQEMILEMIEKLKEVMPAETYEKDVSGDEDMYGVHGGKYTSEEIADLFNSLMDKLSEYAPPYTYLMKDSGSIWYSISDDEVYDDIQEGNILKVEDLSEIPAGYKGYVISVNDHGNVSLYEARGLGRKLREVWSQV